MYITIGEYLKVIVVKLDDFCESKITKEKNFGCDELEEARKFARSNSKESEVAFIARVN